MGLPDHSGLRSPHRIPYALRRGAVCAAACVLIAHAADVLADPTEAAGTPNESEPASGAAAAPTLAGAIGALSPALHQAAVAVLAASIEQLRDDAIARGALPLPPELRTAFAGHLPDSLLNSVRWRVEGTALSLPGGVLSLGETPALTAGHVIVFASAADTDRPLIWAHELYHVKQYRDWGVREFAARYLADAGAIEHEANEFVWRWKDSGGVIP